MKKEIIKLLQEECLTYMTVNEINLVADKVYNLLHNFKFIDDGEKWRTSYNNYYKEVLKEKNKLLNDRKVINEIYEVSPLIDLKKTLDNIQKKALCTKKMYEKLRVEDFDFTNIFTDYIFRNEYVVINLEKMATNVTSMLREICWCKDTDICSNVCSKCENLLILKDFIIKDYERKFNRNTTKA